MFAPVLAVVTTAVLIDDGRPVLFRQQRLGYRRCPFSIIKIRTMRDGRITRVGKVLRATAIGLGQRRTLANCRVERGEDKTCPSLEWDGTYRTPSVQSTTFGDVRAES